MDREVFTVGFIDGDEAEAELTERLTLVDAAEVVGFIIAVKLEAPALLAMIDVVGFTGAPNVELCTGVGVAVGLMELETLIEAVEAGVFALPAGLMLPLFDLILCHEPE